MRSKIVLLSAVAVLMLLTVSFASVALNVSENAERSGGTLGAPVDFEAEGYIPVSSDADLAKVGGGSHSPSDFDAEDYDWTPDAKYYLTNDIVLTGTNNHVPIGTSADPFTGVFSGNGHAIDGMDVRISLTSGGSTVVAGLFGFLSGSALISDLTVGAGSSVTGESISPAYGFSYVGGIVGQVSSGSSVTISGCRNEASVTGSATHQDTYVGGIVGISLGSITISGCTNSGPIDASDAMGACAGGIIGTFSAMEAVISGCSNSGSIFAEADSSIASAGGIIAYLPGGSVEIYDTHNTGTISIGALTSEARTGGIAGHVYTADLIMKGCGNSGLVTAPGIYATRMGGIIGYFSDGTLSVTACCNTAPLMSAASYVTYMGGLFGYVNAVTVNITDSYNNASLTATSSYSYVGGIGGRIGTVPATITNSYTAGNISSSGTTAYAGAMIGYQGSVSVLTNCYFLEDSILRNGTAQNVLTGNGTAVVDGNTDGSPRPGAQGSGAKSVAEMTPQLSDALAGDSIYFTGIVTVGAEDVKGWDFGNIWTIDAAENNGYPIFGESPDTDTDPDTDDDVVSVTRGCSISWVLVIAVTALCIFLLIGYLRRRDCEE